MALKDKHTIGPQLVGFDYQFYFFVYSLLQLKVDEEIGFEVLDDVHVETKEETIFYQLKHSILKLKNGESKNLSTVDSDLWKTINIWVEKISLLRSLEELSKNHFILVTNKGGNNNKFIIALENFKKNKNIADFRSEMSKINTKSEEINTYISNFLKLNNQELEIFLTNIVIETQKDEIEKQIVDLLVYKNYQDRDKNEQLLLMLLGNLYHLKFKTLKKGENFIVTFDEFQKIGERIFTLKLSESRLPKIEYRFEEKDFKDFIFIKQLEDIKIFNIEQKEKKIELITKYFSYYNSVAYWQDNRLVMQTEVDELEAEVISKWKVHFDSLYGKLSLKNKITLKKQLKTAHDIHYSIIQNEFSFFGYNNFSIEISNGLVYNLSERLKIGWVQNWEKIYTK